MTLRSQDLRHRAEASLLTRGCTHIPNTPEEAVKLLQELQVHQIELEMQNEELRQTQLQLESAKARYFDLYERAPVGYCTLNEQGVILEANLATSDLLRISRGALHQQLLSRFVFSADQDAFYLLRKQLFQTGKPIFCELRVVRDAGDPLWVRMHATLTKFGNQGDAMRIVMSDISERMCAEQERLLALRALQQSEARYRAIIEEQTELVCRYLPDGRLTFVNEAYLRYFHKTKEELLDHNYIPHIPTADVEAIQPHLNSITFEQPIVQFEHRVIQADGTTRWQHWSHCGIFDHHNNLQEFQAVGRDITESKEALFALERALQDISHKNEELENFTYTISHDLKAPLFTILGYAKEIDESLNAGSLDIIRDSVHHIQSSARRMEQMTSDLIRIARLGLESSEFEAVDLNLILQQVHTAVAGHLKSKHAQLHIEPSLPIVQGCPVRLSELFQNLVENAIKFQRPDVACQIDVGQEESVTHWSIYVRDNGIGVSLSMQSRIFGLFQKIHAASEGSGIGLALVLRIAKIHHAQIELHSAGIGMGSTFWVRFPKAL